jgi:hypothetical protein
MPISFPANPSIGQVSVQNGRTYTWSGYAWELVSNVSAHASTHSSGGADAIAIDAAQINSGTIAAARLPVSNQAAANLFLWANFR